jgi:hypothetical protein
VCFSATWFGWDPDGDRRYSGATVTPESGRLRPRPASRSGSRTARVRSFRLPTTAVRELLAGREVGRVPIAERWDAPGYVAFTCLDPDGWQGEVCGEPTLLRVRRRRLRRGTPARGEPGGCIPARVTGCTSTPRVNRVPLGIPSRLELGYPAG